MSDVVRLEFTREYLEEVASLPTAHRKRIADRLAYLPLKEWRASVHDRDVAPLSDGIWEVRVLGKGAAFRILFFIHPGKPGRVVVLTSCVEKASIKKRRVMEAAIERAKARREAWLKRQKEKQEQKQ